MSYTVPLLVACERRLIIDKAWEVFTVLASSLLPSSEFLPYVEFFIQNSNNTVNMELPQRCFSLFTECKKVGPRTEVPSLDEIRGILVVGEGVL